MLTYSDIGECQCCGTDSHCMECPQCHLKVGSSPFALFANAILFNYLMVDAVPIHFPLPFLVAIHTRGLDSSLLFAGIESMDRFVSRVQSG